MLVEGRRNLLVELVNRHEFDCIYLQETIKSEFRRRELTGLLVENIWNGHGYPVQVILEVC